MTTNYEFISLIVHKASRKSYGVLIQTVNRGLNMEMEFFCFRFLSVLKSFNGASSHGSEMKSIDLD